jgi:hypothetical protein
MVFGAVEELLDQAVWAHARGAGGTRRALIEAQAAPDDVYRGVAPHVGDGVALSLDFDRLRRFQPSVSKFLEEREHPALAGFRRAGLIWPESRIDVFKPFPQAAQAAPRPADGLVEALACEVIRVGRDAGDTTVALGEALQQVGGECRPLGGDSGEHVALPQLHEGAGALMAGHPAPPGRST